MFHRYFALICHLMNYGEKDFNTPFAFCTVLDGKNVQNHLLSLYQHTVYCSFKDRGALYSLLNLTKEQKAQGVITTSAGNHAQALAYQSLKLDIRATVVMPVQAPVVKVHRKSCFFSVL